MPIYAKTSLELLCDSINEQQRPKIPLTPLNVRVRKITVIAAKREGDPNAIVTLTGRQSHGIIGDIDVRVHRLNLTTLFKNLKVVIYAQRNISYHEAIDQINQKYGLNLNKDDFNGDLWMGVGGTYRLSPGPKSLQYFGTMSVKVETMPKELGRLRGVFLSELKHPQVVDGRLGANQISWGIDYSEAVNIVRAVPAGKVSNGAALIALRELMVERGLPALNMTGATMTHYDNNQSAAATRTAGTNQRYTRCSLMTGIDEAGAVGTLFFHYF